MMQIPEKRNWKLEIRNSKLEIRNSGDLGPFTQGVNTRFEVPQPRSACRFSIFEFRVSNFEFRFPIRGVCCLLLSAFWLLFSAACGYHVAGTASRIPPDVKSIAVPAFKNETPTFHIEQQLTSAVTREFLERTKYRITPNPSDADAVLQGTVKDLRSTVITFNLNTGAATSLQVQVTADVKLEDLHSHKVLFSNAKYIFREEYQVNQNPAELFQEDTPALERLSRDLARTLVTDILENF